jgi:hypothetical protein
MKTIMENFINITVLSSRHSLGRKYRKELNIEQRSW